MRFRREGDAYEQLRGRGPFGLVFADGGRPVEGDDVREFLLRDARLAAAEILATPEMAVTVAGVR